MSSLYQASDLGLEIRWFLILMGKEGFTQELGLITMAIPKCRESATLKHEQKPCSSAASLGRKQK